MLGIPNVVSLGIIVAILTFGVIMSLLKVRPKELEPDAKLVSMTKVAPKSS
jgi:hypothetical protein